MHRRLRLAALAAALPLTFGLLAGCRTEPETFCSKTASPQSAEPVARHTVIVVGNVANSPRWQFTPRETAELEETLAEGGRVDLVSTAGDGYVCRAENLHLQQIRAGMNPAGKEASVRDNERAILREMRAAPRSDGQDTYAALHLAADLLTSVAAQDRRLYVLTNGLNDHGPLDTTTEGALGVEAGEAVSYLRSRGSLPSFTGVHIVASGFGYTAPPQQPLTQPHREGLAKTYQAILSSSSADVVVDPAPANDDPIDTLGKTVRTVAPAAEQRPPVCTAREVVFDQTSALRFEGGSTTFVDEPAARQALSPLIAWLREDPDRTVRIVGTTARATSYQEQKDLGRARARVMRDALVAAGIDERRITSITSNGSYFPEYVDDQAPGHGLIPAAAARNRSLRITLTDPC